jgi:hypothetical protein
VCTATTTVTLHNSYDAAIRTLRTEFSDELDLGTEPVFDAGG